MRSPRVRASTGRVDGLEWWEMVVWPGEEYGAPRGRVKQGSGGQGGFEELHGQDLPRAVGGS